MINDHYSFRQYKEHLCNIRFTLIPYTYIITEENTSLDNLRLLNIALGITLVVINIV